MEYGADELPSEEVRLYKLVTLTGWDIPTIDATDAQTLDWLLGVDAAVARGQKDAEERRQRSG